MSSSESYHRPPLPYAAGDPARVLPPVAAPGFCWNCFLEGSHRPPPTSRPWHAIFSIYALHKLNEKRKVPLKKAGLLIMDSPVVKSKRWNIWWKHSMPARTLLFYRNEIDLQDESQVIWKPYTKEVMSRVSGICMESPDIWLAHVPLLCTSVMEMHVPQRVLRQFGKIQSKPQPMEQYKRVDGRGRANVNWAVYYTDYVSRWNERSTDIIKPVVEDVDNEVALKDYYQWYKSWTVPYLIRPRRELPAEYPRGPVEHGLVGVANEGTEGDFTSKKRQILQLQEDILRQLHIYVPDYGPPHTASSSIMTPGPSVAQVSTLPPAMYMQSLWTHTGRPTPPPPVPVPAEPPSSSTYP
ncbi:hypothetical protein Taro_009446 [Colocasia esculenta]|uniref:Aminotransferase-like plant mobile domain-containing protein n=1 Tax=Colocasia esculenta TaxID=4460 RepID=A0A843U5Q1_COLES|nr:hypothetical protein [Colocasia esculenta]